MTPYIRTVHTAFTDRAPSTSALDGPTYAAPPGLGLRNGWRTDPTSLTLDSAPSGSTGGSRRRPTLRLYHPHNRPAPPPPVRTQPIAVAVSTTVSITPDTSPLDPFADTHAPLVIRIPPASSARRAPVTYARVAAPPPPPDRDARAKLVAGILLNRVHAVGRPIRRWPAAAPRPYIRSGLSSVVSVES